MGIIMDILKDIPLSAVLRERLADQEAKMAVLETENAALKAKVAILEAENVHLRAKLEKMQADQAVHGDVCPYCRQPEGKLLDLVPDAILGDLGLKIGYYQCAHCGKKYDRQHKP
jgi:hypothetical protein